MRTKEVNPLYAWRKRNKLTQPEAAHRLGVDLYLLLEVESGIRRPTPALVDGLERCGVKRTAFMDAWREYAKLARVKPVGERVAALVVRR